MIYVHTHINFRKEIRFWFLIYSGDSMVHWILEWHSSFKANLGNWKQFFLFYYHVLTIYYGFYCDILCLCIIYFNHVYPLHPLLSFSTAAGSFSLPHIISLLISCLVFLLFDDSVSFLRVTYRNTGNYQWPYHWRKCLFLLQQPLPANKSHRSRTSWLLPLSVK